MSKITVFYTLITSFSFITFYIFILFYLTFCIFSYFFHWNFGHYLFDMYNVVFTARLWINICLSCYWNIFLLTTLHVFLHLICVSLCKFSIHFLHLFTSVLNFLLLSLTHHMLSQGLILTYLRGNLVTLPCFFHLVDSSST